MFRVLRAVFLGCVLSSTQLSATASAWQLDREEIKTQTGLAISTLLPVAFNIVSAVYCYQARELILTQDPDSDATFYAEQSLITAFIANIIAAGFRVASLPAVYARDAFWVAAVMSTLSALLDTVSLVTNGVAYVVENSHKYPVQSGNTTIQKRGTSNKEFPILLGTGISSWILGLGNLAFYKILAT